MAIAYSPVPFWFSPFYSARQSPEIPFGTTVCRHTISCWLIPPAWLCSLLPSHRCGWDSLHPSQSLDFLWVSQTLKYQAGSRTAPICPQSWASCTASQRGLKVPDLKLDYFSLCLSLFRPSSTAPACFLSQFIFFLLKPTCPAWFLGQSSGYRCTFQLHAMPSPAFKNPAEMCEPSSVHSLLQHGEVGPTWTGTGLPVYTWSWTQLLAITPFSPVTRVLICCEAPNQCKHVITIGEIRVGEQ